MSDKLDIFGKLNKVDIRYCSPHYPLFVPFENSGK